jgi:hypothetical protein
VGHKKEDADGFVFVGNTKGGKRDDMHAHPHNASRGKGRKYEEHGRGVRG